MPRRNGTPTVHTETLGDVFGRVGEAGGQAQLLPLTSNVAAWTYRWELTGRAQRTLDVASFLLENDVFGLALMGRLIERARAGVHVRLLLESRGAALVAPSMVLGNHLHTLLATGNAEVRWSGPFIPRAKTALTRLDWSPFLASNHDKLIVVDGEEVVFGGRNIGRDYFVHPDDLGWVFSDIDYALRGPEAVAGLTNGFEREWTRAAPHAPLVPLPARTDAPPAGLSAIAGAMDAVVNGPQKSAAERTRLLDDRVWRAQQGQAFIATLKKADAPPLSPRAARQLDVAVEELMQYPRLFGARHPASPWSEGEVRVLDSLTRPEHDVVDQANEDIIALVERAQRSVVILNPYVVLTERGLEVLRKLSARGVQITVLTNSPASSDSSTTQALFLRMWPEILAAAPTLRLFVLDGWRPLHGKVAIIDDEYTLTGSYNLDYVSAFLNGEIGVVVRSAAFARRLTDIITARIEHGTPRAVEYRIARQENGDVLRGPSRFGRRGAPVTVYGPDDHCDPLVLARLKAIQVVLDNTPGIFAVPLMRAPLDESSVPTE